ncbi:MAG: DUF2842 domain-containing protein [Pseudomonadota bacterium]
MHPRQKKLIGTFVLLFGFLAYLILAITIADYLPSNKILEIVYFAITGILWIFPVKNLLEWMNREPGA